jgi:hypothetical protein
MRLLRVDQSIEVSSKIWLLLEYAWMVLYDEIDAATRDRR